MVHTAKEWHLAPSEFFALSEEDKAYMMAHEMVISTMQAWEDYIEEKKSKKLNSDVA